MTAPILDWRAASEAGPARASGKGWQLGTLAELGLPIPPGFVIDAAAGTGRRHAEALPAALVAVLSQELQRRGWNEQPLAVRSSAAAEDSAHASFAGIFRSYLNVRGLPAVIDAVREVLDSAGSPAAEAYRHVLKRAPLDRAANIATYADSSLPLASGVIPAIVAFVKGVSRR